MAGSRSILCRYRRLMLRSSRCRFGIIRANVTRCDAAPDSSAGQQQQRPSTATHTLTDLIVALGCVCVCVCVCSRACDVCRSVRLGCVFTILHRSNVGRKLRACDRKLIVKVVGEGTHEKMPASSPELSKCGWSRIGHKLAKMPDLSVECVRAQPATRTHHRKSMDLREHARRATRCLSCMYSVRIGAMHSHGEQSYTNTIYFSEFMLM